MKKCFLFFVFCSIALFPQKAVKGYLQEIENGNAESVKKSVAADLKKSPDDPNLLYVSALLTDDGDEAAKIYIRVAESVKKSSYADVAYYKLWQYYYAQGLYTKAQSYKDQLLKKYPDSKYAQAAEKGEPVAASVTENTPVTGKKQKNAAEQSASNAAKTEKVMSGVTVQVGAFTKKENAKELMKKLNHPELKIVVNEKNVGGTVFYVVSATGFRSEVEANGFVEKINKKYSLQSRVINR
jgi:tetratricopeptide (TPR) repeat protein